MKILVTGGAGYIGSHTCVELIQAGYQAVIVDNLCNSSFASISRVEKLVDQKISFYNIDIRDQLALTEVFAKEQIEAVIHFAGLKAVGESVADPLKYFDVNVAGTITLLQVMQSFGCKVLVFSSSATVYGEASKPPFKESSPVSVTNPYGRSKLMVEQLCSDIVCSDQDYGIAILRYFNPIGAHRSGLIGEHPSEPPSNLLPYISQVASGKLAKLQVFGGDYDTPDGTGLRDYLHVVDLAKGHIKALELLAKDRQFVTLNLGTGRGHSVLDVVSAFEKVSGCCIPYQIVERRQGDVAVCYADTGYAEQVLGWKAELNLVEMCEDAWRWQSKNPRGFAGE